MSDNLPWAYASVLSSSNKDAAVDTVKNNVESQYNEAASTINNNLTAAQTANNAVFSYYIRSQDTKNIQDDIIANQITQKDIRVENAELAKRQYEINEWTSSDKLDTLFVFQFIFISLLFVTFLEYLKKRGILSSGLTYLLEFIVLVVNIIVIVIRSKYTRLLRDTRYWNKRKFDKYPAPIGPVADNCVTQTLASVTGE